jgi:hypothetical protein
LFDDPETYVLVLETIREHNPTAITNDGRLRNGGSITLRQFTRIMPGSDGLQAKLERALASLKR